MAHLEVEIALLLDQASFRQGTGDPTPQISRRISAADGELESLHKLHAVKMMSLHYPYQALESLNKQKSMACRIAIPLEGA